MEFQENYPIAKLIPYARNSRTHNDEQIAQIGDERFRAVVFATIALFLYLFGYRQATERAENKQMKGERKMVQLRRNLSRGL